MRPRDREGRPAIKKGVFITFEGIDGSGKSTQIARLKESLENRGYSVLVVRDPGSTPIAESIRKLLLDHKNDALDDRTETLLFSAARAHLVQEVIKPALQAGRIVLCDRFAESTIAYQGYGRELPLREVVALQTFATDDLQPDRKILLDSAVPDADKRLSGTVADRMESAGAAFKERVRQGYLTMAQADPERWLVIDATGSVDQIAKEIEQYVVSNVIESK